MRVIRSFAAAATLIAAAFLAAPTAVARPKIPLSAEITGGTRTITIMRQDEEWLEFREVAEIYITGTLNRQPLEGSVSYGYHARVRNVPGNPDYPGYPKLGGALEQYAELDTNLGWADEQSSPFATPVLALECTNGFADCLDEHAILLVVGPGDPEYGTVSTGAFGDLKVNETWTFHVVTSATGDTIDSGTVTAGIGRDFMYSLDGTQTNTVLVPPNPPVTGTFAADVQLSTTHYWGAADGLTSLPIAGGPLQLEYNLAATLDGTMPPLVQRPAEPESLATVFNDGGVMSGYLLTTDTYFTNTVAWGQVHLLLDDLSGIHSAYQLGIMHIFVNHPVFNDGPVTGGMWGLLAQY